MLCSASLWLTGLEGKAGELFFANPRTKAARADSASGAEMHTSLLPSPLSDLCFADSPCGAGRRKKPDWLIDRFFFFPFSDSAVIHVLINWGGGLLGPRTVHPISPYPTGFKNQT